MRLKKKFLSMFLFSAVFLTGCAGGNSPDSASGEKSDEAECSETDTNTVIPKKRKAAQRSKARRTGNYHIA